jgi:hypothetical protein
MAGLEDLFPFSDVKRTIRLIMIKSNAVGSDGIYLKFVNLILWIWHRWRTSLMKTVENSSSCESKRIPGWLKDYHPVSIPPALSKACIVTGMIKFIIFAGLSSMFLIQKRHEEPNSHSTKSIVLVSIQHFFFSFKIEALLTAEFELGFSAGRVPEPKPAGFDLKTRTRNPPKIRRVPAGFLY